MKTVLLLDCYEIAMDLYDTRSFQRREKLKWNVCVPIKEGNTNAIFIKNGSEMVKVLLFVHFVDNGDFKKQ